MTGNVSGTLLTVVMVFAVAGSVEIAQSGLRELKPVDEAATQPEFFTFRAALQVAITRHDVDAIVAHSSGSIRLSFGDDGGPASNLWRLPLMSCRGPAAARFAGLAPAT